MSEFNKRKFEGQSLPLHSKRAYHGDVNPGREYVEPKVYQQPSYRYEGDSRRVRLAPSIGDSGSDLLGNMSRRLKALSHVGYGFAGH